MPPREPKVVALPRNPKRPPHSPRGPQLIARPIPRGERGFLAKVLAKAELATEDIDEPGRLFWRFENPDQVPLGFGGLEIHGKDALLRSVVTLPPAQGRGIGRGIVVALEVEATALGCRTMWLITTETMRFFERLGYAACDRAAVPEAIRGTRQFSSLCPASATVMTKRLR